MSAKPITYRDLLAMQERLIQQNAVKPQTAANRATALRAFVAFNRLEMDDPVGHEFRASFTAQCRAFADHLGAQGRAARNVSNSLAALRPWREFVVATDTERAIAGDNLAPFNQAFRSLMQNFPIQRLADQLCIPRYMLYGWAKGKKPRLSNAPYIHRIESFFGVEQGELAVLAGFSGTERIQRTVGESAAVGYRESLATHTSEHYLFKPDPDSALRRQWHDFLLYKTEWDPALNRSGSAVWRTAPLQFRSETDSTWAQYLDGVEVPSARFKWAMTASFLGWLALPQEQGGAGLPQDSLHTMAWLVVKEHVQAYLRWVLKRSGGKYNGSIFEFLSLVMSLTRVGTGYLQQQPEFLCTLPEKYSSVTWSAMCEASFSLAKGLSARYRTARQQTRDPQDPMRHILELANPLDMVADMVQRMRADRPLGGTPWLEAVWARDLALIKLLVSNPLRLRNMATLTWREDNKGQLYQRPDGSWWIRIASTQFKNTRGAASEAEYDMPVQEMAWVDLERYLKTFRPRLLQCHSDFVFLAARQGPKRRRPEAPWADLSSRVSDLTKRYLWRCPGIGTHAFRHLVATSIIKASNLSDFKTAALVLNDQLATVEKNYAHLRSADGANRMADLLGATFRRM